MRKLILFLFISTFVFIGQVTLAQTYSDTIQANKFIKLADKYSSELSFDVTTQVLF